jgi:hypothetical protein
VVVKQAARRSLGTVCTIMVGLLIGQTRYSRRDNGVLDCQTPGGGC